MNYNLECFLFSYAPVGRYINKIYTLYLHSSVLYILNDDDYNIFTYYLYVYIYKGL